MRRWVHRLTDYTSLDYGAPRLARVSREGWGEGCPVSFIIGVDDDLHPKNGAKHSGCHLVESVVKEAPMKKSTFTEEQIIAVLKRANAGEPVADVCRQAGISDSTFYRWKAKYDGLEVNELKRLKQLEDENRRLKQIVADLTLDNTALKDVLAKKW